MDASSSSSSSLQPQLCNNYHDADNGDSSDHCSHPDAEFCLEGPINSELKLINSCKKRASAKKRLVLNASESEPPSSTSSLSSSMGSSSRRSIGVPCKRRNPRTLIRRNRDAVATIGLPLGMSFAAVMAQVLYRRDAAAERMSPDHLTLMCTSAVRESLANAFGDKLDGLTRNFEQSFSSTLSTLRLIYECSTANKESAFDNIRREVPTSELTLDKGNCKSDVVLEDIRSEAVFHVETQDRINSREEVMENIPMDLVNHSLTVNKESAFDNIRREVATSELTLDKGNCKRDVVLEDIRSEAVFHIETQDRLNNREEVMKNIPMDLVNHSLTVPGQLNQLSSLSPISSGTVINNSSFSFLEKSVMEQSRSNDLKAFELSLTMKKLKMKETQLALNFDLNYLERAKLEMGISKASFKAEKFKNQLEDLRHGELNKKCIDCLIAGLLVMSSSLLYGAYVYSYQRIAEATASCTPSTEEVSSWWTPKSVSSFSSRMNVLWCQVQVMSRMGFGFLMICAIAYLLIWRSTTSTTQTMPVTFILLLLGVACGYCGKLCVGTLGGSGYIWLLYWEILCLLHFLSIVCTPTLFRILNGPVTAPQTTKSNQKFPYWVRRFLFYATLLVFLPLSCGLMPFASFGQWKDHCRLKVTNYLTNVSG